METPMSTIPEGDWKYLSRMKPQLVDRFCGRILDRIHEASHIDERKEGSYKKYLALYSMMREQNRIMATCFDDWRRSTIGMKLYSLVSFELITPEEIAGLAQETRVALTRRTEEKI
jgi:hypothetical protein